MAKTPSTIDIKMSASGAETVERAMKGVERAGGRAGTALEKAGKSGNRSLSLVRGTASGLNSLLSTTANLSTSLFTGVMAGGMVLGGAYSGATSAIGGFKSALETLRQTSVEAANEIRGLSQLAATFQLDTPNAVAETQGWIAAISQLSFEAEQQDVADLMQSIATLAKDAAEGNTDAIASFASLGIKMEDIGDAATGKLAKPLDLFVKVLEAAERADQAISNNFLEKAVGTGGVVQFSSVFGTSVKSIQDLREEYMRLYGITDQTLEATDIITTSQKRMEAAVKGVTYALMDGMAPGIRDTNENFVEFLVGNRDKVREFGELIGEFSGDLYGRLMEFASAASENLSGVGGDLGKGPLKTGLDAITQSIDWLLDRLEEVTAYVGQGQSVEWIDSIVNGLKTALETARSFSGDLADFVAFIRDDVAPVVSSFMDAISGIYDALGVDSTGAQLGISLGILAFGSTIISVTASIGLMIAKISGVGSAVAIATGTLTAALGAMAPAAAAIAGAFVGAKVGEREGTIMKSAADLYGRVVEVAREKGDAAGYALAIAGEAAIRKEAGSSWLDAALGALPNYESAGERVAEMKIGISGLDRDDILKEAAEGVRAAGIALEDSLEIDFGAGITITGAEINSEIRAQLSAIPATIEVTAISGLQEQIDAAMGGTSRIASATGVAGVATSAAKVPAKIYLNGNEPIDVMAAPDQLSALERAQSRNMRGR